MNNVLSTVKSSQLHLKLYHGQTSGPLLSAVGVLCRSRFLLSRITFFYKLVVNISFALENIWEPLLFCLWRGLFRSLEFHAAKGIWHFENPCVDLERIKKFFRFFLETERDEWLFNMRILRKSGILHFSWQTLWNEMSWKNLFLFYAWWHSAFCFVYLLS